jgi:hypothetical protein|tara:strand:+ start:144 stop:587 length:444 start_codon:yes stop_codon:yes gene_type:complete
MSIRNSIAENIVSVLQNATDPQFVLVSRAPIDPGQLSNAQFPCVYIETLDETREDDTMGMSSSTTQRQSIMNVGVNCFVKTSPEMMDITRNDVIERVEEALDADRTRGGVAWDTQLTSVDVDNDVDSSIGLVKLNIQVLYKYTTGVA